MKITIIILCAFIGSIYAMETMLDKENNKIALRWQEEIRISFYFH